MALVGPGAQQIINDDIKPLLSGASEYEYVTILNPLTDDFQVRVAQEVPVNMPFEIRKDTSGRTSAATTDERDVTLNYGLKLKNPDYQAKKYIYNDTIIPAGQTVNFKGSDAQVVVKQLVDEILQREGNRRLRADPNLRRQTEERIIKRRGSMQDILDAQLQTPQQQINEALNRSNEVRSEPAFTEQELGRIKEATAADNSIEAEQADSTKRTPGRPKKSE